MEYYTFKLDGMKEEHTDYLTANVHHNAQTQEKVFLHTSHSLTSFEQGGGKLQNPVKPPSPLSVRL